MDVTSTYKYARISARKARDVAREIQGLPVSDALDILNFTPRKGAELFSKTMKTALADAENNFELSVDGLFVKSAVVGEGPTFKRFKARARGSAGSIRKRTSHLTVVLSDEGGPEEKAPRAARSAKKAPAAPAKEAPVKETAEPEAKKAPEAAAEKTTSDGARLDEARGMVYDSAPAEVDNLEVISGVGPVLAEKLNSVGIYRFEQIANWTEGNVREFDELLSFGGRIEREEWITQAKTLLEEKRGN
ncbi:MAG: 50S ribosomal protein L22 [Verrucomicrobiaceae bacterium]|nr:50S ribosomal protein L22 [Verrucomicrobiaceae bacterium]